MPVYKTSKCWSGNHAACTRPLKGRGWNLYSQCECACHDVMETDHNTETPVMESPAVMESADDEEQCAESEDCRCPKCWERIHANYRALRAMAEN